MTQPCQLKHAEILRIKLEIIKREHRDLDEAIHALHDKGRGDALTLRRLKRQKLAMKDEIRRLEDEITPDIIA